MKDKLTILLKKYPLFLFLLPVFFVLHGYRENYDFVSIKDSFILTGIYLLSAMILFLCFRLFFKNRQKAAITSFLVMAFHFFFGSIQDGMKRMNDTAFFTRYSFLLPAVFILFIITVIYIKKRKAPLGQLGLYLNSLLLVLLFIDLLLLAYRHVSLRNQNKESATKGFTRQIHPANPDIYFIILDEYAGLKQLDEQLAFDNSPFEDSLRQKRFHVIKNSRSNYTSTPLSVASFLHMNYPDLRGKNQEQDKVLHSYHTIRQSILLHYLTAQGYDLYNFSIFDLPAQKAFTQPTFLPTGKKLITSQTFLTRIEEDLGYHLYTTFGFKQNIEKDLYTDLENNNNLYERTFRLASLNSGRPKFVYTHLMMPHFPYYFTKEGKQRPVKELLVANKTNPAYYVEYLAYCNTKILALTGEIQKKTPGAIIVIAGDHGFRASDITVDKKYLFYNLCAVHLPSNNYSPFYEGLTAVNLFRTILNTEFQQQLPILKDSCMFEP